uniref:Uncharacterized protein n=1 Tax=Arundo donax TaxID=35708 RepID=A0A0A8ZGN6_ARUDO
MKKQKQSLLLPRKLGWARDEAKQQQRIKTQQYKL